jgi:hypothetical protein
MAQQTRTAITSAWLIISAILLFVFPAPYLLSENALLSASGTIRFQHHEQESCPLCGMTRAFMAISRGNLFEAVTFNRWSVALYGILLANELSVAIFLVIRIRRLFLSHHVVSCVELNTSIFKGS